MKKIVIVGCGNVGMSYAYAMVVNGVAIDELVLIVLRVLLVFIRIDIRLHNKVLLLLQIVVEELFTFVISLFELFIIVVFFFG